MSNINKEQTQLKKEEVFRTGIQKDLNVNKNTGQDPLLNQRSNQKTDLLSDGSKKDLGDKLDQSRTNQEYLDRIIENSTRKNLAIRVRQDQNLSKDKFVNVATDKNHTFKQQYPSAVKDKFFGSTENDRIADYKRSFRNADLNTAREYEPLKKFISGKNYKSGPVKDGAKDEIFNEELDQYVTYLINNSIDSRQLTEDYLSKHIHQVYEFNWKLSKYNELKEKYPKFFKSLPETKKIYLERMAASSETLDKLIESHLYLHGIIVTKNDQEGGHVYLRMEDQNKEIRHRKRRELKAQYDQLYDASLKKLFADKDYALARQFADNKFINESADLIKVLEDTFGKNTEVSEVFGSQVNTAIDEIKKTLAVRDQLVKELKENLNAQGKGGERTGELRKTMRHTNDKLILCSAHIDNYKKYLYFLNGNIDSLPKDTVDFLAREKHEDLLEPVKFKAKLDFVEEALALKAHIENKDKNKGAFKAPSKVSKKKFYDKRREYDKARKDSEEYGKLMESWKKVQEDTAKRAEKYAKDNHLKQKESRFHLNFIDPRSEYLKNDDYFWITVAGSYIPTEDTPKKAIAEIRDKGVKPWLDRVLAMKPEEYKDVAINMYDDPLKEGYFEKYAMFELGWDTNSFSHVLKVYGLDLTDEEFFKTKVFHTTMQDYSTQTDYVSEKMSIPFLNVIGTDPKLVSEAYELSFEILDSDNKEVRNLIKRYDPETTGLVLGDEQLIKHRKESRISIGDYIANIIRPIAAVANAKKLIADDYDKQYAEAKERAESKYKDEMHYTSAAAEKKKTADAGYPEMNDAQIDIRLWLKQYHMRQNPIPIEADGQKAAFKKAFGTRTDGAADLISFRKTQFYVELDPNGTVRSAYRGKDALNKMDFEDYTAGGERRHKYLRRKVRNILLRQKNVMEHLKAIASKKEGQERLEYLTAHFTELNEMNQLMQGFKDIAYENADYLRSDDFTVEEKDALRLLYTDNPVLDTLNSILESFAESLGMKTTGEELPQPSLEKEKKEDKKEIAADNKKEDKKVSAADRKAALKEAQKARQKNALDKMDRLMTDDLVKKLESYDRFEKMSKEKPEMVRKIADFEYKIRLKYDEFIRLRGEFEAKLKPLESEQQKLTDQKDRETDKAKAGELTRRLRENGQKLIGLRDQYKEVSGDNQWSEPMMLAKEMKDYLFGLKDTVSDDAVIFAEANGFGEYLKQEDIDNAALRIEKKKVMEAYGYPVPEGVDPAVKAKTEMEIRELLDLKNGEDIEKALEEVAKSGVGYKRAEEDLRQSLSVEDFQKLVNRFGSKVTDNEDLRCFAFLFKTVRRDIFGNPLPGYEKNAEENSKIVEDYISGNETRVKSVLRKMADKVLQVDISEEKMTDEYFRAHPREITETLTVLHNFTDYYSKFKKDFFTGDAFTMEEQNDLRKKIETDAGRKAKDLIRGYMGKIGYTGGKLIGAKSSSFRNITGTYKIQYKTYRDMYEAYVEKEKAAPLEKNVHITKLNHLTAKADKLGLPTGSLKKVMLIADGQEKGLDDKDRNGLKEYYKDIRKDEEGTEKRKWEEPDIFRNDIIEFRDQYDWLDKKSAETLFYTFKKIQVNSQRIQESDELYRDLTEKKEIDSLQGSIRAYTDRLLSIKMNETTLNEEYMSRNLGLFISYIRAYELLPHIQDKYPGIMDSLPLEKRVSIMFRQQNYKTVKKLVDVYLKKNGVKNSTKTEETDDVVLYKEPFFEMSDTGKISKDERERRNSEFGKALEEAKAAHKQKGRVGKAIANIMVEGLGTEDGNACIDWLYDHAGIEQSLKKNETVYKNCKPYYDRILAEYKKESSVAEGCLYEARAYVKSINARRERLKENREILKTQERLKASGSAEYSADAEAKARSTISAIKSNLQEDEKKLENAGIDLLNMHKELEKYHELFRMGAGEGGLVSKETEDFLNTKGFTEEYGLILANIIFTKTKIDDYADPVFDGPRRVKMAERDLEKHTDSILEMERTYSICARTGYTYARSIREQKIRNYMEGLSKLTIEFNEHTLSDEYIAEHLGEYYEYMRAFDKDHFETFKEYDVNQVFESLSEKTQKDILKRVEYCEKVRNLLYSFQQKYRINLMIDDEEAGNRDCKAWKTLRFGRIEDRIPVSKAKMAEIQKDLDEKRNELLGIVKEEKAEKSEKTEKSEPSEVKEEKTEKSEPSEVKEEKTEKSGPSEVKEEKAGYKTAANEDAESVQKKAGDMIDGIFADTLAEIKVEEDKAKEEEKAKKEEEERAKRAEQDKKEEEERKLREEREIKEIEEQFARMEREAKQDEEALKKLPAYEIEPGRVEGLKYELQDTNNCWCCSGTFIFNQFNGLNKIKGKKPTIYNQYDMRKYEPKLKNLDELKKEGYDEDEKAYKRSVRELQLFAGRGKTRSGNIYETADFFLEKRKDIMVHQIVFQAPGTRPNETEKDRTDDRELINKQREAFLNEVKAVLDTGNYVAVNTAYGDSGHYRTIIGIKGNRLKCLNSSNGDEPEYVPINFFIKKYSVPGYASIELNWISKKPGREQLLKDYEKKGLSYDDKKKAFSVKASSEGLMNVGQTLGVSLKVSDNKEAAMAHSVYIPKKA